MPQQDQLVFLCLVQERHSAIYNGCFSVSSCSFSSNINRHEVCGEEAQHIIGWDGVVYSDTELSGAVKIPFAYEPSPGCGLVFGS